MDGEPQNELVEGLDFKLLKESLKQFRAQNFHEITGAEHLKIGQNLVILDKLNATRNK